MANFDFLKQTNKNLFNIADDAEKLYTSQFFEQCITQTRKFGEQICKTIMIENRLTTGSFDDMIATLKDKATYQYEKEFVEDLYFLKKQGNNSVHSSAVTKNSRLALECLQRAFEIAISYAVYYKNGNKSILKKHYDISQLVKHSEDLEEVYEKNIAKYQNEFQYNEKPKKKLNKPNVKQSYTIKPFNNKQTSRKHFWLFILCSTLVSLFFILLIGIL